MQTDYFNQESDRLLFRALREDDIESWSEFFMNNDRLHFLGIDTSKDHQTLATEWVRRQLERYRNEGLGHLAVIEKRSGKLIGMAGILLRDLNGNTEYEIGYSLKPNYWNLGFGTEMAKQMKRFGQQNKIAPYFISIIEKTNADSMHVARKNGMDQFSETQYLGMEVFVFRDKQS